jgi:hypothetical protein
MSLLISLLNNGMWNFHQFICYLQAYRTGCVTLQKRHPMYRAIYLDDTLYSTELLELLDDDEKFQAYFVDKCVMVMRPTLDDQRACWTLGRIVSFKNDGSGSANLVLLHANDSKGKHKRRKPELNVSEQENASIDLLLSFDNYKDIQEHQIDSFDCDFTQPPWFLVVERELWDERKEQLVSETLLSCLKFNDRILTNVPGCGRCGFHSIARQLLCSVSSVVCMLKRAHEEILRILADDTPGTSSSRIT